MNPNLTEIAFVMDRSGSMESMKVEAIGGFNAFIQEQMKGPGEVRFTLILFDNEYLKVIDHQPLPSVQKLTDATYEPRGSTALLDAMGRTIDEIGQRLAKTPEQDRPGHVIIACMTDGAENASRHYSNSKLAAMIELQRTSYSWEFVFLGATLEAREMAKSWTVPDQDIDSFVASAAGVMDANMKMSSRVYQKRMDKSSKPQ
jgi:hypothetical protein